MDDELNQAPAESIGVTAPIAPDAPPPKKPSGKRTFFGCFVLLVIVAICGIGLTSTPSSKTVSATNTPTPIADKTEAARADATQTANAPTPRPTNTPKPTANAETLAVRDYLDWATNTLNETGNQFSKFQEHLSKAGDDVSLFVDDDWKTTAGMHLGLLQATAGAILEKKNVPAPARALHVGMKTIAADINAITNDYARGIDHIDASLITRANKRIGSTTEHLSTVTDELVKLKVEYGK